MNRLAAAFFSVTLSAPSLPAQTSGDATLQALLTEVRQLRLALEKSTSVSTRIQVTFQRMQLQQEAVTRASRELEEVRNQIAKSKEETANITGHVADMETQIPQEQDAGRRKALEDEVRRMKLRNGDSQKDLQLVARESEASSRLQLEQARLSELSERLNSIERMLESPQPKEN